MNDKKNIHFLLQVQGGQQRGFLTNKNEAKNVWWTQENISEIIKVEFWYN